MLTFNFFTPSCNLTVLLQKSLPFSLKRLLVINVETLHSFWGGIITINITTTRKCSKKAEELQANKLAL